MAKINIQQLYITIGIIILLYAFTCNNKFKQNIKKIGKKWLWQSTQFAFIQLKQNLSENKHRSKMCTVCLYENFSTKVDSSE